MESCQSSLLVKARDIENAPGHLPESVGERGRREFLRRRLGFQGRVVRRPIVRRPTGLICVVGSRDSGWLLVGNVVPDVLDASRLGVILRSRLG